VETLLDHHLATFDGWLQAHLTSLPALSRSHYLAVVTLFDQLDKKKYHWQWLSAILQDPFSFVFDKFLDLIGGTKEKIEFSRIVSKFLMDQARAGLLWVNSQTYADLARYLLEFLRDM